MNENQKTTSEERNMSKKESLDFAKTTMLAKQQLSNFDPEAFLINLKENSENPELYLEVKFRIIWFRLAHPDGKIETEVISIQETGLATVRAVISNGTGTILASAHGTCVIDLGNKLLSVETAETSAIGRALSFAGFGTANCGGELETPICDGPYKPVKPKEESNTPTIKKENEKASESKKVLDTQDLDEFSKKSKASINKDIALATMGATKKVEGKTVKEVCENGEEGYANISWAASDKYHPKTIEGICYKVACEFMLPYLDAKRKKMQNEKKSA